MNISNSYNSNYRVLLCWYAKRKDGCRWYC